MTRPRSYATSKSKERTHPLKNDKVAVRLDYILNSILLPDTVMKSESANRKIAMRALCQIMLCRRERLNGLPLELLNELNFFKDELEFDNPFGGKVQLNPIPTGVKQMILDDSNVINRLRTEQYPLESDQRIWTFPRYVPDSSDIQTM